MALPSNPFTVRSSEQAGSDTRFLGLFGPGVLQGLVPDGLWDRLVIFRSAPGGGKTSILRLFTPGALRALHENRNHEATRSLAEVLTQWGVLTERGPALLGTRLTCDQQYGAIRDVTDDDATRRQLFCALVNARIVLSALRGAVTLGGGRWPDDVSRVRVAPNPDASPSVSVTEIFPDWTGGALYRQACEIERTICTRLNDLGGMAHRNVPLHAELWSLHVFSGTPMFDDAPIADRVLIAFDDIQMLHRSQRDDLRRGLMSRDLRVARWAAERWQGLSLEEAFDHGATAGRDYQIVQLDGWADDAAQHVTRFERTLSDIANRRTQASDMVQEQAMSTAAFDAFLQDAADAPPPPAWLEKTISDTRSKVEAQADNMPRYRTWLADQVKPEERTLEALWRWRELEILIARDLQRRQGDLFPDQELTAEDFRSRHSSGTLAAAELFAAREYKVPYYYGMRRLSQLSSWNIEQFLDLAGDLFDLLVMAVTLKKPARLSPRQQHEAMRSAARAILDAIPRRIPHGDSIRALIEHVGRMSEKETYRPTAPYDPGVTGFAISMADLSLLKSERGQRQDQAANQLMQALTVAMWNNLLHVRLDYPCKGRMWAVFYLNRLICAHYHLPLHYGGFREKKLADVKRWVAMPEESTIELALHE